MGSFAAALAYDGKHYLGWQSQSNQRGVADVVMAALSKVANHPVVITCAGRTDARVHALCQVIHFEVQTNRTATQLCLGVNTHLPKDISFLWVSVVDDSFSARFSAQARHYRYWCIRTPRLLPVWVDRALAVKESIDLSLMEKAANYLLGEKDFSALRSQECQAAHARRYLYHCKWQVVPGTNLLKLDVIGNAFLHHMVRFIVGGTLAVGKGQLSLEDFKQAIDSGQRKPVMICASPIGLYFVRPVYDKQWALPNIPLYDPLCYQCIDTPEYPWAHRVRS